jgi:CheY-like chemotaxis protein
MEKPTAAGRLLIVDDSGLIRKVMVRRFEGLGYEVVEARHGWQALELVEQGNLDLVILDILMPDMSGLEVLKLIRETYSAEELPVIVVSGRDDLKDVAESLRAGANDHLPKPLDFERAAGRIAGLIAEKRRRADAVVVRPADGGPAMGRPGSSTGLTQALMAASTLPDPLRPEAGVPISDDLPLGTRLGNYVVTGMLGRGGMGTVYEVENPLLHRNAALKILPAAAATDSSLVARFQIEAKAAAKIDHPNVVGLYDVGEWRGRPYLVMQLVHGSSAQTVLDVRGPFPPAEATRIAADVCRGLAAAHSCGMLHRDIKPANIMVGVNGAVKLADFGLAKFDQPGTSSAGLTNANLAHPLGTPLYMSPEQCLSEPLDVRSDVYALGGTYYALLTGRPPFGGHLSSLQTLYAHCNGPVPDPRQVAPDLPPACSTVVMKAMAKSRNERYPTAGAMLKALEALLSGDDGRGRS